MLRHRPFHLRSLLFALLAFATVVRPLLIAACDIHAAAHAHAAQPHEHVGEGDAAGADGDGHGTHESLQQGSLALAADAVATFELPTLAFDAVALPQAPPASIDAHYAGAPFRPPIG